MVHLADVKQPISHLSVHLEIHHENKFWYLYTRSSALYDTIYAVHLTFSGGWFLTENIEFSVLFFFNYYVKSLTFN